jgi:WD40 repeat protein
VSGQRKALIVANDEYEQEGLRQLLAPTADAEELKRVLGDQQIGDFAVQVVRNEPAHIIQVQIEELFAASRPDDVLLLHFSCHGLKSESGELFFAAPNTLPNRLGSTAISADFVQRCMRASRARSIVLLLDCCYGGAFAQGVAVRGAGDVNVLGSFPRERLGGGRGRAVITASSAMEYAFEGDRLADRSSPRPSVFTGALVEGLITGDADRDQDGWISLNELYDYIFDKVREQNPHQTPSRDFEMQGDLYIARRSRPVTTPAPLPPELQQAIDQPLAGIRAGAVQELVRMLQARHAGLVLAARTALERLTEDDSRIVSAAAAAALGSGVPSVAATHAAAIPSAVSEYEHVISGESESGRATTRAQARTGFVSPASPDAASPAPHVAATASLSNEAQRSAQSGLELSTTTVEFGELPHHSQSPQSRIRLGSTSSGSLNARARTQASWLKLRQEGEELLVAVDTDAVGVHWGTVTIDSDGGSATIFVRAQIVPALRPAPETAATSSDEAVSSVHERARRGPQQDAGPLSDQLVSELTPPEAEITSRTADRTHSGAARDRTRGTDQARRPTDRPVPADHTSGLAPPVTLSAKLLQRISDAYSSFAFSPDGRRLAALVSPSLTKSRSVGVWDLATGSELMRVTHAEHIESVTFRSDGTQLATASRDNTARIWDLSTGKQQQCVTLDEWVNRALFSPDGKNLAVMSNDYEVGVRVVNAATGSTLWTVSSDAAEDIAYSPDGSMLAVASISGYAKIRNAETGKKLLRVSHDMSAENSWLNSVAFSPDSRRLATTSADHTSRIWDARTGDELIRLRHKGDVECAVFSPNGKWLATTAGKKIQIWDAFSGAELLCIKGEYSAEQIAFSPDGTSLASNPVGIMLYRIIIAA